MLGGVLVVQSSKRVSTGVCTKDRRRERREGKKKRGKEERQV
jgi:hypothetical protein